MNIEARGRVQKLDNGLWYASLCVSHEDGSGVTNRIIDPPKYFVSRSEASDWIITEAEASAATRIWIEGK